MPSLWSNETEAVWDIISNYEDFYTNLQNVVEEYHPHFIQAVDYTEIWITEELRQSVVGFGKSSKTAAQTLALDLLTESMKKVNWADIVREFWEEYEEFATTGEAAVVAAESLERKEAKGDFVEVWVDGEKEETRTFTDYARMNQYLGQIYEDFLDDGYERAIFVNNSHKYSLPDTEDEATLAELRESYH